MTYKKYILNKYLKSQITKVKKSNKQLKKTINNYSIHWAIIEELYFSNWVNDQVHSSKVIINNYINDSDETETDCENETNFVNIIDSD
jgi:hypothetical protein